MLATFPETLPAAGKEPPQKGSPPMPQSVQHQHSHDRERQSASPGAIEADLRALILILNHDCFTLAATLLPPTDIGRVAREAQTLTDLAVTPNSNMSGIPFYAQFHRIWAYASAETPMLMPKQRAELRADLRAIFDVLGRVRINLDDFAKTRLGEVLLHAEQHVLDATDALRASEVADRMDRPRATIYYWLGTGRMHSVTINGLKMIPLYEVERIERAEQDWAGMLSATTSTPATETPMQQHTHEHRDEYATDDRNGL